VATRKIVNGSAVTLQRRGVVPVPSLPRRAVERPRKPVGPILMAKRTRPAPHAQGLSEAPRATVQARNHPYVYLSP
jgi:hypothetical protein